MTRRPFFSARKQHQRLVDKAEPPEPRRPMRDLTPAEIDRRFGRALAEARRVRAQEPR